MSIPTWGYILTLPNAGPPGATMKFVLREADLSYLRRQKWGFGFKSYHRLIKPGRPVYGVDDRKHASVWLFAAAAETFLETQGLWDASIQQVQVWGTPGKTNDGRLRYEARYPTAFYSQ